MHVLKKEVQFNARTTFDACHEQFIERDTGAENEKSNRLNAEILTQ